MTTTKAAKVGRFTIDGRLYTTAAVDELTLKDVLLFDTQVEQMGLSVRWDDVERKFGELARLSDAERKNATLDKILLGVTIWASRRTAGEDVTFEEAVSFSFKNMEWLPATGDHEASADPQAARQPARKASGRAGAKRPAAAKRAASSRSTTSKKTSAGA